MRWTGVEQNEMFSHVSPESRVPMAHPLRRVPSLLDGTRKSISRDVGRVYASDGGKSLSPQRQLLQVLYSIRSARLLREQMDDSLRCRWFAGQTVEQQIWVHSTFTKKRDRLIEAGVASHLLRPVGRHARCEGLLSSEHFSLDGTMIEAWSSVKCLRHQDGEDVRRRRAAARASNSTSRSARTKRIWRRRSRRRNCSSRAGAIRRSRVTQAMCSRSIVQGCLLRCSSTRRAARRNARWRSRSCNANPLSSGARRPATRITTRATSSLTVVGPA